MNKMKFLAHFCLSLALATTALARRDRNAMAMATLEKLESLLSEEMALEQELAEEEAYEQELAEEEAYEQELAEEEAYEQELAEEEAYEQELAEEEAYEQELAEEEAYEQELERQNLIAALQSACGRGSGAHVQTLSSLANLLSTGEVTTQEAMNYIEAQGLDKHIARIQAGVTEVLQEVLTDLDKHINLLTSDITERDNDGQDVSKLKKKEEILKRTQEQLEAAKKDTGGAAVVKQKALTALKEQKKEFEELKKKSGVPASAMGSLYDFYIDVLKGYISKIEKSSDPKDKLSRLLKKFMLLRALANRAEE